MAKATYAPRCKVWPPDGYVPPVAEEFDALRTAARDHAAGWLFRAQWEQMTDEQVTRRYQLVELAGTDDRALYSYARELRREMTRRNLVHRSLAVLRCESCTHATERLFEATQDTHPGLANTSGNLAGSAWYCARCWSGEDER